MARLKNNFNGRPPAPTFADSTESITNIKAKCPKWVNAEGRALFDKLLPMLAPTLTEKDVYALYQMCHAYGLLVQATEEINKHGLLIETRDGLKKNPAIMIFRDASNQFNSIGARFGMTPSDRARLTSDLGGVDDSEEQTDIMSIIRKSTEHRVLPTGPQIAQA